MKKLILGILLLLPSICNSQSIVEFYNLFEHTYRKSIQNTAENQVLIDEKNDFIQITDLENSEDFIRFKSFTKKDQTKVFGFQYDASQPGLGLRMSRTDFYIFKDKKWQELSSEVYSNLGFKDFWGNQPLPYQLSQEFNLDLDLPRSGTTILAKSFPAVAVQFPYSNLPKGYEEMIEKRKYKTIELNWNKTTGKFKAGKKY